MNMLLSTFRGLGQIMLQRHALAGILFLCGLAVNSVTMAFAALLGSTISTVLAYAGKFPRNEIEDGLYGFNGALVAIAAMYFYSLSIVGVLVGAAGVLAATLLMRVMQKHALMPFTFPFIVTVWVSHLLVPTPTLTSPSGITVEVFAVDGFFHAFGQVMFQANSLTGLVFLGAVLISSRKSAAFAALGAALGIAVALVFQWPVEQMAEGVYGYNAILAAIAISLISPRFILPVLGALLSIAITKAMLIGGIPALTFPFVLSTWIVAIHELRKHGQSRIKDQQRAA